MSETVIRVEDLSKLYQLGEISTGTLSRDLNRWWARIQGKEDPYRKIGQANDRSVKGTSNLVWALQDINFEVKQGEILGIIGRNGAGKSTLLKLLSRVTKPTTGRIRVKGRMASLLEVGTGFHPELTGRENIFLNGAILGMRKAEIQAKLDEIVDFAGVERYIDTPVKRYSSGMYVRLAFAVAAHLEPEILVIDEVLAVGDAEFQKKCLGKMKDVSEKDGRTVLFVSHNMESIQKLCTQALLLHQGTIHTKGNLNKVIEKYISDNAISEANFELPTPTDQELMAGYTYQVTVEDTSGALLPEILIGDSWQIKVKFILNRPVQHFIVGLGINSQLGMPLQTSWSRPTSLQPGQYEATFLNQEILYTSGMYYINVGLSSYEHSFQYLNQVAYFRISDLVAELESKEQVVNTKSGLIINQMSVQIQSID
jgi:lipopolysaccharide transport system ATP-binding protein